MRRSWLVIAALAACKGEPSAAREAPAAAPPPVSAPAVASPPAAERSVDRIDDLPAYKAVMAKRYHRIDEVFDRDGTDCAKIATDLRSVVAPAELAASTAFEKAHPKEMQALDGDEAWGDVVKASAGHMLRAFQACRNDATFADAYAKVAGD
jgi:hypothetical protein